MKKISLCVLLSWCFLSFAGLAAPLGQRISIKDDLGDFYVLDDPPKRIISLAPNVTEILFALGLEKRIVGVTRFCNYPKNAQAITRIGGMIDPDMEKIIDLHPDLVIAFRGNPLNLVRRLKDLGLPVFVLEAGVTLESVFSLIERIGLVTGREKPARILIENLHGNLQRIRGRLENIDIRPKIFINLHGKGLWTCGKNSFLDDLVRKAGGVNISGTVDRAWFNYNREELIQQNPEYIIVITRSDKDFQEIFRWFTQEAHLEGVQAVQNENIHFLEEDLVTRPGPRIFLALERLARILHPSSFEAEK